MEGNKEYIFEDVKSGSGYWEEVFRNLAISLSRSQPYRSPARHLGMTNRVSPLRRSTPSPLRSISTQRGSSRHPSPSTMRKPISITPTRVIPALTTSTITSVHSDNSKYSNPANIAPLQIPAQISATEVYNTEALLQKDDSQLTTNTDYVNVEAVPDICQWQLPTELLLMNEPVIETTEPAVEYNVHDASPIESFRASTTSPTSKPNLTAPTSSSTTTHVPTYSSGGFNLYNAVYYTSFAVFLVAAGVMNTIYPSSTATAATASLTASTADTSIASLMSIPEYEGSSVGNTCSFTELFIGPVDVYSASQSDSDAAMISALGFSINRYSALHINIFDQSGPDFVYSVYSELDNDEE